MKTLQSVFVGITVGTVVAIVAFVSRHPSGKVTDNELLKAEEAPKKSVNQRSSILEEIVAGQGCPEEYPKFGSLGDLLRAWHPNIPDVPGHYHEYLEVLNMSDPIQQARSVVLRDCEVPFKVYGVPAADNASRKWTDEYLTEHIDHSPIARRRRQGVGHTVMRSESNRFMFWHNKGGRKVPGDENWQPPTTPVELSFADWREWARQADGRRIGPHEPHLYLTSGVLASAKTPPETNFFVANDLPFFSSRQNNFFITDVTQQKGIQCRFGARGIIAESHYDHGKNFVLMLRGRKRYVLNPPSACERLGIIADMEHPSYRHSWIDWTNENEWPEGFADAPALETVVEEGEFLYIPSFWYHYIVSEGFSAQCNARSGQSLLDAGAAETKACIGHDLHKNRSAKVKQRKVARAQARHRQHMAGGNKQPGYEP